MRTAALVPAYDAADTVHGVVASLARIWPGHAGSESILVVDDGSHDDTAHQARDAGALVICHGRNRGKGAALRTGLQVAHELGFDAVVTVDADAQHPADEALRLADLPADPRAIVLGVRDLIAAGAPRANQVSNRISNYWLSLFTRQRLHDTQCGLRRYPVRETLALQPRDDGYAFEAEVLLLATRAGFPLIEVPVRVVYDMPNRTTHFHVARDPARIIVRVLRTLVR